jgi:hypothetical protein
MAKPQSEPNYAVLVAEVPGGFVLRVRELLLTVRAANLHDAYELLRHDRQEILDLMRSMDAIDELPLPLPSPAGAKIVPV